MSLRKHVTKLAGVSQNLKNGEMQFHSTSMENRMCIWLDVPGRVQYTMIKLPKPMNKLQAARFLMRNKNFKNPRFQKFLQEQIERREEGMPVRPRGPRVDPQQQQRRRLIAAKSRIKRRASRKEKEAAQIAA
jgi:hypothetical protein